MLYLFTWLTFSLAYLLDTTTGCPGILVKPQRRALCISGTFMVLRCISAFHMLIIMDLISTTENVTFQWFLLTLINPVFFRTPPFGSPRVGLASACPELWPSRWRHLLCKYHVFRCSRWHRLLCKYHRVPLFKMAVCYVSTTTFHCSRWCRLLCKYHAPRSVVQDGAVCCVITIAFRCSRWRRLLCKYHRVPLFKMAPFVV